MQLSQEQQAAQQLELLDINDVVYDPWWLNEWLWYCIYVAVGTSVCVGIYLLVRPYFPSRKVPYWQKSLNSLHALSKKYDDPKLFYISLTDTLKHYLQERYSMPLVGTTDTELLEVVEHKSSVPKKVHEQLKTILEGVVTIKFAHAAAALEQMQHAQKVAVSLVNDTRPDKQKEKSKK